MAENAKENEIEELLARLEKTDDIDFLVSNMQILSGISNPKFADRVNDLKSKIEKTCKEQAETALASNEPLSQNPDYPEALQYAEYAKILAASDNEENQKLGEALFQKAEQELAAYDKENGLDNIDKNTPYAENYERLNDLVKPFEEIDQNDQILAGFAEKLDSERALDIVNLARMEVLSELAASSEELTPEEIKERIEERAQQLVLETYTTLSTDCYVAGGFEKTTNEIIEELKRGEKVAELPENPDLLTFTHYAMTHIEDEGKTSLPDTEQYKKVLEETLNDPKVLEDPEKLAALKYLIEHHNAFGLSGSDETVKKATRRMQQGALYITTSAVIANHTTRLQYNSTRIAQITGSLVPPSLQKSIAELEAKYPLVKTAKKALIRGGLTMASSAVLGPVGPFLVSSAYAYKAFKDDRAKYAAEHGGSTKGYIKNLFTKDNLAKTISMAASPVISAVTLGMAGAGTTALVSTVTRGVMGLVPSTASISQQAQALKAQQAALDKKLVAMNTKNLTDADKKVFQTITKKEIANPKKMTSEQKAVWEKLDPKERETIEKEAQNASKRKKAIGWTLGIAAGGLVLAAIGYEAKEHGLFNGVSNGNSDGGNDGLNGGQTQGSEGAEGTPGSTDQSQGNEGTTPQSEDGTTPTPEPEAYQMQANNTQIARVCDADPRDVNAAMKELDPNWKWHNSADLKNMIAKGELNAEQLKAIDHLASTKFDANGHIVDPELKAFYEKRWAEHQAEIRAARESSPVSATTPQDETLTETPTTPGAQNPDEESYEVRHQNSDDLIAQETQTTPLYANDPVLQQSNRIIFGTKESPAVDLSSKHPSSAYEQTDSNGYTVRHIDEFKNAKFIDESKDGVADAIEAGRMLKSSEVTLSPEGNVLETSETTYGRALNGETYVKDEVVTSYDGDRVCQTNTHNSLDGRKTVTSTEFAPGTTDKPMSVTKELYHKGQSEPYQTQTAQYDEFTGQRLSLKTINNETGKETIQSLANPKEIYQERAKVLSQWQKDLSTMDRSSSEYTALSQKAARLAEAQKLTTAKAAPYLAHVGGRS